MIEQNTDTDLNKLLLEALSYQQNGKVLKAIKLFKQILKQSPENSDALHGLGLAYAQKKDYIKAVNYLKKAIQFSPNVPAFHNNLGNALKKLGLLEEAMIHYREALRLKDPYPEAHNNLGTLYYRLGMIKDAIIELEKAVQSAPEKVNAHFNLANCYVKEDRFQEALAHYLQTLKLRPDHLRAMHNTGIILTAMKRFDEAKFYLSHALSRESDNKDVLFHLALINSAEGEFYNAKVLYERLLDIDPNNAKAHHNLATVFLHLGNRFNALEHFQAVVILEPENQTAQHMVEALSGSESAIGAPPEFVQALFDQYAYNYDEHVKKQLKYQVPALIRENLSPFVVRKSTPWQVLDLGCGTGLCAPYLHDIADLLIGVDISPNMIEVAKQLGGYHKLYVENITHFLPKHSNQFDLIVAADVLCYFGDLTLLFGQCRQALKQNALFAFTLEKLMFPMKRNQPYRLMPSGRFTHSQEYIDNKCFEAHFKVDVVKEIILRYQEDEPVVGFLYIVSNK